MTQVDTPSCSQLTNFEKVHPQLHTLVKRISNQISGFGYCNARKTSRQYEDPIIGLVDKKSLDLSFSHLYRKI